jgi:hypothetical protein
LPAVPRNAIAVPRRSRLEPQMASTGEWEQF